VGIPCGERARVLLGRDWGTAGEPGEETSLGSETTAPDAHVRHAHEGPQLVGVGSRDSEEIGLRCGDDASPHGLGQEVAYLAGNGFCIG
jgi:hypothetical protein